CWRASPVSASTGRSPSGAGGGLAPEVPGPRARGHEPHQLGAAALVLATARHRLKEDASARQAFEKGRRLLEKDFQDLQKGKMPPPEWTDVLMAWASSAKRGSCCRRVDPAQPAPAGAVASRVIPGEQMRFRGWVPGMERSGSVHPAPARPTPPDPLAP